MAVQKVFNQVDFFTLKDLINLPLPEKLEEITYVANATNFRRFLFHKYGKDNLDLDHEKATNPDTRMTYLDTEHPRIQTCDKFSHLANADRTIATRGR